MEPMGHTLPMLKVTMIRVSTTITTGAGCGTRAATIARWTTRTTRRTRSKRSSVRATRPSRTMMTIIFNTNRTIAECMRTRTIVQDSRGRIAAEATNMDVARGQEPLVACDSATPTR